MPIRILITAAICVLVAVATAAQPDLRQMAGQPLPSGDLPAGSVSVRVVRGGISNNVPGVEVEMIAAGGGTAGARATTDQSGRALFNGLPAGSAFQALVTVDGERLASQTFTVPPTGGLRILLAAGLGAAKSPEPSASPAAPAVPGSVTLGGQSRIVVELAEGSLEVFCLLDVLNTSGAPVATASPVIFELPAGAANASMLEGATASARVEGARVIVPGPFAPGATSVQFAYRLPTEGSSLAVRQPFPIAAPQGTVIVRKIADVAVSLVGERGRREVPIEGRSYLVLNGGPIPAGGTLDVSLSGLPSHAGWPRFLALGLAAVIAILGVWLATSGAAPPDEAATRLRAEREARFGELVALEKRLVKKAEPDPASVARRAQLIDDIASLDLALDALRADLPPSAAAGSNEPVAAGARTSAAQ